MSSYNDFENKEIYNKEIKNQKNESSPSMQV